MSTLKHIFISSCQTASALIDKKSVMKLTLRENMMLRIHTSVCDACKNYEKQSRLLHDLLKEHLQHGAPDHVPQVINNELKEKILSRFKKE